MRAAIKGGLGLAALGLAWLAAWPVNIEPQAWQAPPDPGLSGAYAENDALRDVERLHPDWPGVGALSVDAAGALYAGVGDGRILRVDSSGTPQPLGVAPKRAIALHALSPQRVLLADQGGGAWVVGPERRLALSDGAEGIPFRYVTNIGASADGSIYILEGSTRFGAGETYQEFLESAGNGRLLRYVEADNTSRVVLRDLHFPTGLAFGPGDEFLLIVEMSRYRVLRYWLRGPRAGQSEVFIDALPGFPDGIRWNGRDTFWLSLYGPRSAMLDYAAARPWLRRLYARLPAFLQPRPKARAWLLGLDREGRVVHNLQDAGDEAFAPITTVLEHEGWLYLGSLRAPGIARLRVPGSAAKD